MCSKFDYTKVAALHMINGVEFLQSVLATEKKYLEVADIPIAKPNAAETISIFQNVFLIDNTMDSKYCTLESRTQLGIESVTQILLFLNFIMLFLGLRYLVPSESHFYHTFKFLDQWTTRFHRYRNCISSPRLKSVFMSRMVSIFWRVTRQTMKIQQCDTSRITS